MKQPPTKKQIDARKRNWQVLRLRGAIDTVKTSELISQVDKDIIISLLNNSIILNKISYIILPDDYTPLSHETDYDFIKIPHLERTKYKKQLFIRIIDKISFISKMINNFKIKKYKAAISALKTTWNK